ncbi:MAG TPA: adenylosuccinate synthetase [Candidatus Absconditabacterales bacterium]|nr:adenylosuccinate synthetase [Candidatus Absconditabacterales bacterium]
MKEILSQKNEQAKYNKTQANLNLTNENFENKVWERGNVTVIYGGQQGDEGKGKVTSQFKDNDRVAVSTGGGNAGHQAVCKNGEKVALHELPGGAVNEKAKIYIGQGRVVNIKGIYEEIKLLESKGYTMKGRTFVAGGAQIIFNNLQRKLDGIIEGLKSKKVGTTKKGIGPAYALKALRTGPNFNILSNSNPDELNEFMKVNSSLFTGLDLEEIMNEVKEEKELLQKMIDDGYIQIDQGNMMLNEAAHTGDKILIEHSQSSGLAIDGGNYPYCTSSDTTSNGVSSGLNLPEIHTHIMVTKAIKSKVGGGYFPTKLEKEQADQYRGYCGDEVGATSGRTRDVGYYDIVELKKTLKTNKADILFITKYDLLDALGHEAKIGEKYVNTESGKIYIDSLPYGNEYENIQVEYSQIFDLRENIKGTKEKSQLPQNYIDYTDYLIRVLGFEGNIVLGTGIKGEEYIVYK